MKACICFIDAFKSIELERDGDASDNNRLLQFFMVLHQQVKCTEAQ